MSGFTRLTNKLELVQALCDPSMKIGFIQADSQYVIIMNINNDLLNAYPEQSLLTFKSDVQGETAEMFIDMYIYVSCRKKKEVPVVLSCKLNNKTYLLCVENNSVVLKESEMPGKIHSETSEFIFYKRDLYTGCRTFESSVESGYFLAWSKEDRSLGLRPYDQDKLDESAAFYLIPADTRVFKGDPTTPIPSHVWNNHNELLIAHPEQSIVKFEPEPHIEAEKATFFQDIYRELAVTNKGTPMAMSCKVDNKTYLLCVENNSVILKEDKLPAEIPTKTSELIFYKRFFSDGQSSYCFESSFIENHCLAWNTEGPEKKLILKPYSGNGIDETMKFDLQEKTSDIL
ncbi:uncharacterized protein [Dendropsophus ebraccatus]|uniref:uncharacterized protein n=1 Tax=Dendropsophus ebraccatus TaxID=150705 RepID=UPI0038310897